MSNEFKLSDGSMARKRQQSITLIAIRIERLASEGARTRDDPSHLDVRTGRGSLHRMVRPSVRQGETAFLECAIEKGGEYTKG
jgi:hypothetical protein